MGLLYFTHCTFAVLRCPKNAVLRQYLNCRRNTLHRLTANRAPEKHEFRERLTADVFSPFHVGNVLFGYSHGACLFLRNVLDVFGDVYFDSVCLFLRSVVVDFVVVYFDGIISISTRSFDFSATFCFACVQHFFKVWSTGCFNFLGRIEVCLFGCPNLFIRVK